MCNKLNGYTSSFRTSVLGKDVLPIAVGRLHSSIRGSRRRGMLESCSLIPRWSRPAVRRSTAIVYDLCLKRCLARQVASCARRRERLSAWPIISIRLSTPMSATRDSRMSLFYVRENMQLVYVIGDSYRGQRAGGRGTEEGRRREEREILYFPDHKSTSWEKTLISCGVQGEDEGTSRLMVILGKIGI